MAAPLNNIITPLSHSTVKGILLPAHRSQTTPLPLPITMRQLNSHMVPTMHTRLSQATEAPPTHKHHMGANMHTAAPSLPTARTVVVQDNHKAQALNQDKRAASVAWELH
jgi:hypothetical protein